MLSELTQSQGKSHLYEVPVVVKCIETEVKRSSTGLREGMNGSYLLGTEFQFCKTIVAQQHEYI
jgi:hypothetical protein